MISKRTLVPIVFVSLLPPCIALAEEMPTASPGAQFELHGLSLPSDVATGKDGQVYVVDSGNHQVAVFDDDGKRVTSLGMLGSDEGQFLSPLGIATAPDGDVYVADKGNRRLVVFDARDRYVRTLPLEADGDEVVPIDVAVGPKGRELFVTDNAAHRVVVFDTKGRFLRAFGSEGEDDGQFRFPATIDSDAAGNVYVVDVLNARVQKFDASGTHLLTIGRRGGKPGSFFRPKGVAVDARGKIYVSDSFLGVIQVFDAAGELVYVLGDEGTAMVRETPVGLTTSGQRLYVAEMLAGQVAVLAPIPPASEAEHGE